MDASVSVPKSKQGISFHVKFYCWSLVAEPLMFFVLTDVHQTGSALTLSRLIQICVGMYFVAAIINKGVSIPNPSYRYYKFYWRYLVVGLVSSLLGATIYGSYTLSNNATDEQVSSLAAQFLRGAYTRPFIEIFLSIYYFVYFFVVPRYLLRTQEHIRYLLDLIIVVFKWVLFVGLLDVAQYLVTGRNFIARHLVDSQFMELGTRFHGFAGEPRDAFPYLIFGLAIYYLRAATFQGELPSKLIVKIAFLALILTQSGSGLIGIVIAGAIFVIVEMRFSLLQIGKIIIMIVLSCSFIVVSVLYTDRLMEYVIAAEGAIDVLKAGDDLHPILFAQSSNIFPIWQFFRYLSDFNIMQAIFGSGFGSASFINNNLGNTSELVNPQSNFIRLIYEVGFLGLWLYVTSQLLPMQHLRRMVGDADGRTAYLLCILLIGVCLSHRSTTIFIYCGIVVAIIEAKRRSVVTS